jgi:DNA-binding HxlR family transcriptional regulator
LWGEGKLVARTAYATVPPHVEYEVTPRGKSLREALPPIAARVIANREALEQSRQT